MARVGCKNARTCECILKPTIIITLLLYSWNISLLIYTNYFTFLRRMIILHLSAKSAISATALPPTLIFYWLHKTFCGKVWKIMLNLIKVSEFNSSIIVLDVNYCFIRILTTTVQHPPLFLFTNVRRILQTQFLTFRGALYYVM